MDIEFYNNLGVNLDKRDENSFYFDSPLNLLVEKTVARGYGHLTKYGALVVETGKHTGRSAKDRYLVSSPDLDDKVWWKTTHKMTPEIFSKLKAKVISYLDQSKEIYITERSVGAHKEHTVGVRLVTNMPQHALFSKYLFRHKMHELGQDDYTILHAPDLTVDPKEFDTKSGTVIVTCFKTKTTIIVGTMYAGEIKKSMFSVLNFVLPDKDVLPMHSGANRLDNGQTSVFFGLSGTGKTTLSTDDGTFLIGDDEHGMSENGIFNFEGGCYAKTYKLTKTGEPGIFAAISKFGALLENVIMTRETGEPDFFDAKLTENGRASYPLDFIHDYERSAQGKLPKHIFFLSADAFGVLPPVALLSKEQAMFYFILGYTAKLAGTEIGIKEPEATFSPCFGAPFMLRKPEVYAQLLGKFLDKHDIKVWLINTGWTGGAYGVGQRFPLNITRQIIRTIQSNALTLAPKEKDPIFGFDIPVAVRNVPTTFLHPRESWTDKNTYDETAKKLAVSFHEQMQSMGDFYRDNIAGAPVYSGEGKTVIPIQRVSTKKSEKDVTEAWKHDPQKGPKQPRRRA